MRWLYNIILILIKPRFNKGLSLYQLGKFVEAIENYDKALEMNPIDDVAWLNKGAALYQLRKFDEAIESYGLLVLGNVIENVCCFGAPFFILFHTI